MKVKEKQRNSRMCIICGMDNDKGVKAQFSSMEDGSVMSLFRFRPEHQSYPARTHGGMITAMLDELGGRAYWAEFDTDTYAVTTVLETKFRKPVPYDADLVGYGKVVRNSINFYQAVAEIRDKSGAVLASAQLKYLKLNPKKIADADPRDEMFYYIADDIAEI